MNVCNSGMSNVDKMFSQVMSFIIDDFANVKFEMYLAFHGVCF